MREISHFIYTMFKKIDLLKQEHYVAPVIKTLSVDTTGVLCQSPAFGEDNEAGSTISVEETYSL